MILFIMGIHSLVDGLSPSAPPRTRRATTLLKPLQRRDWWGAAAVEAAAAAAAVVSLQALPAEAFSNAVPEAAKYSDRPKRKGPQPVDLGLKLRDFEDDDGEATVTLKECKGAPNCFSTTGYGDGDELLASSTISPWRPPRGMSSSAAAEELLEAVKAYPPGQGGIDGGGFKVIKAPTSSSPYLYVQFESLRQGYIDDVEFAVRDVSDGPAVLLRSASRVGYLDFAVNAKRLNYLSEKLRDKGWTAAAIDSKSHPDYFYQNSAR